VTIRFRFNPNKALQAIMWLAQQSPGITLHTIVKVCFYADKKHLNRYGRPVFGDRYRAMPYGPVGSGVYDILKHEPLYLELVGRDTFPFVVEGRHVRSIEGISPDLSVFSESDVEVLKEAYRENAALSFDALVDKTHADPAYRGVEVNDWMHYEDLVDEREHRDEVIEDLKTSGHRMVI
jgi:uncharacterized phage-associated protein